MEYTKIGFIIIFTGFLILLYYLMNLLYIYIQSRRIKKGKKAFRIREIFDIRIVILLMGILLYNTTKIFTVFYTNTFPNFEIQVSDNINDIDFNRLYNDIEENIKVENSYVKRSYDFSKFVVDKDGTIEKLFIYFSVPRLGYNVEYSGVYQNKKIIFTHSTYYYKNQQNDSDRNNSLKSALELLEETNITSLINFSNLQDDVLDEEIINYEIKLLYHSKELGYWSLYFFDFPPYGKEFILETSGEFSEINGTPKTDFVGVFNIFYKTRDNVENNRFTPAVIVFKNKSLSE